MVDAEEYFGKEPNNLFGEFYYQYEALTPNIMGTHKDKNVVVYCKNAISSRLFARQLQAKYPNHTATPPDGGSNALTKDTGMSFGLVNLLLKMPWNR